MKIPPIPLTLHDITLRSVCGIGCDVCGGVVQAYDRKAFETPFYFFNSENRTGLVRRFVRACCKACDAFCVSVLLEMELSPGRVAVPIKADNLKDTLSYICGLAFNKFSKRLQVTRAPSTLVDGINTRNSLPFLHGMSVSRRCRFRTLIANTSALFCASGLTGSVSTTRSMSVKEPPYRRDILTSCSNRVLNDSGGYSSISCTRGFSMSLLQSTPVHLHFELLSYGFTVID